jgi:hypothetical protein
LDHVAPSTVENTLASLRYEIVELIHTAIERSQATTHELIMAQFERFNANLEQHRGQPPQPPTVAGHLYNRNDMGTTPVYEPDPYIFEDAQPRRGQLDDDSLSRSLRTQAPVFTAEITFSEFKRDYVNYLRAINSTFPDMLEGAAPVDADVHTAYQSFQEKECLCTFASS